MAVRQSVAVKSLDHCVLPVMDLWRAERFYTDVLGGRLFQKVGMTFDEAGGRSTGAIGTFVKVGRNHIGLFLQNRTPVYAPSSLESAYPCWGLGVAGNELAATVERVRDAGGRVSEPATNRYGREQSTSVRCTDSEGNAIELIEDSSGHSSHDPVAGLLRLHFEALDLSETAEFYGRFLGAETEDENEKTVVLGLQSGQQLVFHKVDELSPSMLGPYRGRHFAFHVDDETFHAIVERLREAGVEEGDVRGAEPGGNPFRPDRVGDELGTYFNDPSHLRLQIINENSVQAAAGRPMLRYVAA